MNLNERPGLPSPVAPLASRCSSTRTEKFSMLSRAAMLRCVRDVIKEATLRALSASAPPAEEGAEEGEGTGGSRVEQRG